MLKHDPSLFELLKIHTTVRFVELEIEQVMLHGHKIYIQNTGINLTFVRKEF